MYRCASHKTTAVAVEVAVNVGKQSSPLAFLRQTEAGLTDASLAPLGSASGGDKRRGTDALGSSTRTCKPAAVVTECLTTTQALRRDCLRCCSLGRHPNIGSCADSGAALRLQRREFRRELCEGPLDLKAGERTARKGPPVAHSLPVYKTTHKLNHSVRWKNANLITNVAGGKDYRLRETQGEGTFDESGMYRDWLYGDERRYANYIGVVLGTLSISLFLYTMRVMGAETWDIPTPVLSAQRKRRTATTTENDEGKEPAAGSGERSEGDRGQLDVGSDALAMLKKPAIVSKATPSPAS